MNGGHEARTQMAGERRVIVKKVSDYVEGSDNGRDVEKEKVRSKRKLQ